MWLGYFEEFLDYMTQGESLAELQENLHGLYKDLFFELTVGCTELLDPARIMRDVPSFRGVSHPFQH